LTLLPMAGFSMGWRGIAFAALVLGSSLPFAAAADIWSGFYRPSVVETPVVPEPLASTAETVCLKAILDAQTRYGIPDNLLLAIGIQEAGRNVNGALTVWPWTANSLGKGKFFGSKQALEAWVRQTQANGTQSIDVGCMQVNQKWHAKQFTSLEDATDPARNVDYAARFLRGLYAQTRDWWQAAGRYHSSTDSYKELYLQKLAQNQRLANANLATFAAAARTTYAVQSSLRPALPQPSINWSSNMTGDAVVAGTVLSIYSASPLQALLPNYAEAN
jgi:hypothetical protein